MGVAAISERHAEVGESRAGAEQSRTRYTGHMDWSDGNTVVQMVMFDISRAGREY